LILSPDVCATEVIFALHATHTRQFPEGQVVVEALLSRLKHAENSARHAYRKSSARMWTCFILQQNVVFYCTSRNWADFL